MPTCGMHSLPIQRIFLLLSVAMTPTFNRTKEYPGSYMYVPIAIIHGLPGARVGSPESLSLGVSERSQCIDQRNFYTGNHFIYSRYVTDA